METGVRGWLIWISIAFLLGDVFIRILWGFSTFILGLYRGTRATQSAYRAATDTEEEHPSLQPLLGSTLPYDGAETGSRQPSWESRDNNIVSRRAVIYWLMGSTCLCLVCTFLVFRQEIPVHIVILAISIAFPLCIVVMQSTGETDTVPSNALGKRCP